MSKWEYSEVRYDDRDGNLRRMGGNGYEAYAVYSGVIYLKKEIIPEEKPRMRAIIAQRIRKYYNDFKIARSMS